MRYEKIDDKFPCADAACGASCHDLLDDYRGEWLLQCCLCGTMQTVRAIPGFFKPAERFVFASGLFAGMTTAEVAEQPRGVEYLEWAAKNHPSQAAQVASKSRLDALRQAV